MSVVQAGKAIHLSDEPAFPAQALQLLPQPAQIVCRVRRRHRQTQARRATGNCRIPDCRNPEAALPEEWPDSTPRVV